MQKYSEKVIIAGFGEHGFIAENILSRMGYSVIGFLEDNKTGAKIVGKISDFGRFNFTEILFFIAIGSNNVRREKFTTFLNAGCRFANAIHPNAIIEENVSLGGNVMVGAFSYVNIGTQIRDNTIINSGCIVEHDNLIGSHCHLAPGVVTGGRVQVGDGSFIGIGSAVRDGVLIGQNCVIGMGANVVGDAESNGVYYGNPAKLIKKLREDESIRT